MGTAPASNRFSGICSRTLPNLLRKAGKFAFNPEIGLITLPQSFPTMGWGSTPRVYPSSSIRLPRAASRLPKNSAGLDLVWLYRRQLSMHTMEVYVRRVGAMRRAQPLSSSCRFAPARRHKFCIVQSSVATKPRPQVLRAALRADPHRRWRSETAIAPLRRDT